MTTDPEEIRDSVAELLAGLPEITDESTKVTDFDLDVVAARLEEAHGVLVRALESVDRGASEPSTVGASRPPRYAGGTPTLAGESDPTWGRNG